MVKLNKFTKKMVVFTLCAVTAVSSLSFSVNAANKNYSFSTITAGKGSYGYWAYKDDNEQMAYFTPKKISGIFSLYAVNTKGEKVSYAANVSKTGKVQRAYFVKSNKGAKRGIAAYNLGNKKGSVSGTWCP